MSVYCRAGETIVILTGIDKCTNQWKCWCIYEVRCLLPYSSKYDFQNLRMYYYVSAYIVDLAMVFCWTTLDCPWELPGPHTAPCPKHVLASAHAWAPSVGRWWCWQWPLVTLWISISSARKFSSTKWTDDILQPYMVENKRWPHKNKVNILLCSCCKDIEVRNTKTCFWRVDSWL